MPMRSSSEWWSAPYVAKYIRSSSITWRALSASLGGSSAKTGFDCSGFVGFLYKQEMGIQLPRSSRELIKVDAPKVARAELEPGDVLFFNNRGRGQVSHVGIFIGDDQFIHSSSSRSGGVRIDSLEDRYWKASYMLAKRILPEGPQPFAEQSLSSEN